VAPTTTATGSEGPDSASADALSALFTDEALTAGVELVACMLENGSESNCYQFEVSSLPSTVDTDGPYCPEFVGDEAGIWVWDGDEPGLYALDAEFWAMVGAQGFDFVDADGNVSITDPGAGPMAPVGTANSCLEASADGSFHLRVLMPAVPERLDEPTALSTVSRVGLALDGVTIFGEAPGVAGRGGLPALDACGGHIDPSGYYHWHFGSESIQTNLDEAGADASCDIEQALEAILGFAYDGYPIYGPEEEGAVPPDLDACSGHLGDTPEFGATYHYHLSYESPNLPGCLTGVTAVGSLTSPDNPNASLPGGSGRGGMGAGGPDGAPPDFTEAAEVLGVTLDELLAALGPPPPDLEVAAATLGVTVEELQAALPPPPQPRP
jgi:hypothetical protein